MFARGKNISIELTYRRSLCFSPFNIYVFFKSRQMNIQYIMNIKETIYATPSMEVYEILIEGVLCGSNEGVGEEDGNGGFN